MNKVLIIFGTRPEAIKLAPIIDYFKNNQVRCNHIVCVTAQHREMLDQVLDIFNIHPDIDLDLMQDDQQLHSLTSDTLNSITAVIRKVRPKFILVQGDTTTAMSAALASFYEKIPVGHVEAGLRTGDVNNPFPEEINRRIISELCALNFAPTKTAVSMLRKQGIAKNKIILTGNTIVDSMLYMSDKCRKPKGFRGNRRKMILVTAHRRENFGYPLLSICKALKKIVLLNKDVEIIYPVHLNPNVQSVVRRELGDYDRIFLVPPLSYLELIYLLKRCYIILTDSGGIQEEAPTFKKPVLVLRKTTERPEGIKEGIARLIGCETRKIVSQTNILLRDPKKYQSMVAKKNPYGDGMAAKRIVVRIEDFLSA